MERKLTGKDTLDIVFASDHNYIKYTAVTLASVLKNLQNSNLDVRVFVLLGDYLSSEPLSKIEELQKIHAFSLVQIKVEASQFENIKTTDGITIATYYRLAMHKLLPDDCRLAIYLDSDLIVQRSLHELLEFSEADVLFHGVEDSISKIYNRRFGLPEDACHVNAGVLLVNVELMRNIDFDRKIKDFIDVNQYRIVLGDQQIIAEVFHEYMRYLPLAWNVHGSMFKKGWLDENIGVNNHYKKGEAKEAITNPGIIHYTLKRKPWMSIEHPKSSVWYDYLSITPFNNDINIPSVKKGSANSQLKKITSNSVTGNRKGKEGKPVSIARIFTKIIPAYWKSIILLRKTRLEIDVLNKRIDQLSNDSLNKKFQEENRLGTQADYKMINTAMAHSRPAEFLAKRWLNEIGPNAAILSNVKLDDIDGGYAENIKSIFRTSTFAFKPESPSDAVVFLSQRLKQGMFWQCLEHAYLRDKPVVYAEVALFGGFAGFFDQQATLREKKALGFLLDDMGYYFDSNQASRFETVLNSDDYFLEEYELLRSRLLIDKINKFNITKYNKYVSDETVEQEIEDHCVLVVDQKKGDASIAFAGASDATFTEMMLAAIKDNPDKKIYFKRHPDSVHKNFNSYRNRNLKEIEVLPDDTQIHHVLNKCDKVYTVSSQVGFEGLLKGKQVVCFGVPFYAGWGLTDDRIYVPRRNKKRKIEEIFHQICINQSVYFNPYTGRVVELEELLKLILKMRETTQPEAAVV